jgi:hypothetical protein
VHSRDTERKAERKTVGPRQRTSIARRECSEREREKDQNQPVVVNDISVGTSLALARARSCG